MKFDALSEWQNFEAALIQELNTTPLAEFNKAWQCRPAKTLFYGKILLPNVAARLGYNLGQEHLRCDFVILNNEIDRVPVVFIESENNHESATHEIDQLCAVCTPVKVLILSCSWAHEEREKWLPGWTKRIATHHKYYDLNAVYMIVVGENDGMLRYHMVSIDTSGKEIKSCTVEIPNE